jgi:superfamily II DNA or RNA helicase
MIHLQIDHGWTYVSWDVQPAEFIVIQEATSYLSSQYWMSPMPEWWDGRTHLLRKDRGRQSGRFPTGIISHVLDRLRITPGLQVKVEETRIYPLKSKEVLTHKLAFQPRDYQFEAANAFLNKRRGIIKLPTAAGKTKTAVAIMATLDVPTLWITHEGALGRQSYRAISESVFPAPTVGFYGGGERRVERWTVALVQSLHARKHELDWWFSQIKLVVIDEVHHTASRTWYDAVQRLNAPFRLGISATPFERSDKSVMELVGSTGAIVYEKTAEELKGNLSRPHVEMIHLPDRPRVISSAWDRIYRQGIVENRLRNEIILERMMRSVRERAPCLVPVASLDHGRSLKRDLGEMIGVDGYHEFISGETPQFVRDELFGRMRRQDLRVLIATDGVAGEGQDIPAIRRIVVGGGLKGAIIAKQRIGRGMRPEEVVTDNTTWGGRVDVHDFVDNNHHRLQEHSEIRRGYYAEVGAVIEDNQDHLEWVISQRRLQGGG